MIKFAFVVVSVAESPGPGPRPTPYWFSVFSQQLLAYWRDMSGGRMSISFEVHADVTLQMTQAQKDGLSLSQLLDAIRTEAEFSGVPFAADEHLIAVMDDEHSGLGVCETDPVMAAKDLDAAIMSHELGHFFQHLNKLGGSHADWMPGFQQVEYGDPTCVMGAEGGKYSYSEASLDIPGSPGHADVGPAVCPPMTVRMGWLDDNNPAVAPNVTRTLPATVQIDPWRGAPPPNQAGRPTVAVVDDHAPDGDRLYVSLRSPEASWDRGFPPAPGGPAGSAMVVVQEMLGNGATLLVSRCPSITGSYVRLGRAPLRVDVMDGGTGSAVIRISADPWRNWTALTTPGGQPVHRVAAVARLDSIDIFVIAQDGLVYTLPFRKGSWQQWLLLEGAGFSLTAGMAVASTSLDSIDLFVVGTDDQIRHHHCGPSGWDPGWPIIDGGDLSQQSSLAAAPNGPDRVELLATTSDGRVVRAALAGGVRGNWEPLPALPQAHSVAANRLADDIIQVHAVTEGAGDGRLFSIVRTHGNWEPAWFNHGQTPLDERAAVAAASPASGDAFLIGAHTPMFVRTFHSGAWLVSPTHVDGLTLGGDSSIAAVSREPRSVDVAAIAEDHTLHVISASPNPNFVPASLQTRRTYQANLRHGNAFISARALLTDQFALWNFEQTAGPAELFTIHELEDASEDGVPKTLVAIEAFNGRFVTAESGGGNWLIARADRVGPWEQFKMFTHPQDPTALVLQALGGHSWRAVGDGGGLVDCRGLDPLAWEKIMIV